MREKRGKCGFCCDRGHKSIPQLIDAVRLGKCNSTRNDILRHSAEANWSGKIIILWRFCCFFIAQERLKIIHFMRLFQKRQRGSLAQGIQKEPKKNSD